MLFSRQINLFDRRRTYSTFLVLALVGIVFSVSETRFANKPPPFLTSKLPNELKPDTEIISFSNIVFDQHGGVKYTMESPHLFHFPHNDTTLLSAPVIHLYEGEKPPWRIFANKGQMKTNDEITLNGDVQISNEPKDRRKYIRVNTNSLTLHTEKRKAQSEEEVSISGEQSTIKGVGLRADLIRSTMSLVSNVEGSHIRSEK